jgi:hypothetical protein
MATDMAMVMDKSRKMAPDLRIHTMPLLNAATVGKRAVVALTTLVLAYAASTSALSQAALMAAPDTAMQFAPIAGRAEAITADRLTIAQGIKTDLSYVETLAKRSLTREPINPVALRVLGVVADARSQKGKAIRLFNLSEATSRRDLGTQLALIQFATDAGDLPRTLKHYDTLLRTSVDGQTILFPILTQGLVDAEIRQALVNRLNPPPPWFWAFVNHAIAGEQPPVHLAQLLGATIKTLPDDSDYRSFHARMLSALSSSGQQQSAAQYYLRLPGAQAGALKDVGISPITTDNRFVPITWEALTSAYAGATRDSSGRAFRVSANPGERAIVLRRLLFLQSGPYRVGIDQKQISGAASHQLNWSISCSASPVWTATLTAPQSGTDTPFVVPSGCNSQSITLEIVGGTDESIVDYMIEGVRIRRADQ